MPIYMDSHIVPGVEAEHVATAHKKDLGVQDQFGCRNMTYWVDEDRGRVFCLIDAPNEEAVRRMHAHSHGLVPHEIIKVNSKVVEAFLGRVDDPQAHYFDPDKNVKIFNDPAFRILLAISSLDKALMVHKLGSDRTRRLYEVYRSTIVDCVSEFEGSEVVSPEGDLVVSFTSVSQAFDCTRSIQKSLHVAADELKLRMALHAGLPVDGDEQLFGSTIRLARFLCHIDQGALITLSAIVDGLRATGHSDWLGSEPTMHRLDPGSEKDLDQMAEAIGTQYRDPAFGVVGFGDRLGISKAQLYRKCTSLTGMSPNILIKEYRLRVALQLLRKSGCNVSETAYECGFNSPSYFSRCFQERFGLSPRDYGKIKVEPYVKSA